MPALGSLTNLALAECRFFVCLVPVNRTQSNRKASVSEPDGFPALGQERLAALCEGTRAKTFYLWTESHWVFVYSILLDMYIE